MACYSPVARDVALEDEAAQETEAAAELVLYSALAFLVGEVEPGSFVEV